MTHHGFVRVGAAVPSLRIADCAYNVERILGLLEHAQRESVDVVVFPELSITGYTCADLFQQVALQRAAVAALEHLVGEGAALFQGLAVVGLPLVVDDQLFNCAAVIHQGRLLGMVPKSFIPNYKEFYEGRWFAAAAGARSQHVLLCGQTVPFGTHFLLEAVNVEGLVVGIEICEDLWVPIPPSSFQALQGAMLLLNLSASNEVIGKASYRRQLVLNQSGRCLAAYVYASCGVCESTTDVVFGGHCLIAENATLLAESPRFQRNESLLVADIDLDRLRTERLRTNSFGNAGQKLAVGRENGEGKRDQEVEISSQKSEGREAKETFTWETQNSKLITHDCPMPVAFSRVPFTLDRAAPPRRLVRSVDPHPFVPGGQEQLRERCEEIFHTQVAGLARRLEHLWARSEQKRPRSEHTCDSPSEKRKSKIENHVATAHCPLTIGVSGGLDSTLALLVACKTMDALGMPRAGIRAFTLPGFGTTARTRDNAWALMKHLGVSAQEIDIRGLCLEEMRLMGYRPFGIDLKNLSVADFIARLTALPAENRHDLVFENVQARMRMNILMNSGFVIGTGDLSEIALGWSTYNGDHMSMYNPNCSIPKTLVRFLVDWVARNEFSGEAQRILLDIVATTISPELLPVGGAEACPQPTEEAIGPYELHDFFLFHFLRYGAPPEKIIYLAEQARFDKPYTPADIRRWLRVFVQRFFANQFKRSCLPDGPKVGTVSLSPRGDWRMPSDAQAEIWLRWAEADQAQESQGEA